MSFRGAILYSYGKTIMFLKYKQTAMTLAEVMITLTVVGIISAIVIPALVQNYQKHTYVASLKKAYLTLSSSAKQLAADNGGTIQGVWINGGNDGWARWSFKYTMSQYMSVKNICSKTFTPGCWAPTTQQLVGAIPQDYNWSYGCYAGVNNSLELADGMLVSFGFTGPLSAPNNCNGNHLNTNDSCGDLFIDTNGYKAPNVWGRDIFQFYLRKDGTVIPDGSSTSPWYDCGQHGAGIGAGYSCAGRIIEEGWQMNY